MTQITSKGRKLAEELGFSTYCGSGVFRDDKKAAPLEACSLLMRNAITYQQIQVMRCNGPAEASSPTLPNDVIRAAIERLEVWTEKRDEQLSRRIEELTVDLVKLGAPINGVDLGGDPRGVCVKLIRTDGRSNSWGGESRWCVPLEG